MIISYFNNIKLPESFFINSDKKVNTEIDSKNLKIFNRKTKPSVKRAENLKNLSGNLKNIGKYNSVLHVLKKKFNALQTNDIMDAQDIGCSNSTDLDKMIIDDTFNRNKDNESLNKDPKNNINIKNKATDLNENDIFDNLIINEDDLILDELRKEKDNLNKDI